MTLDAIVAALSRLAAPVIEIAGSEDVWVVGGAIRDLLMGRATIDLDVAAVDAVGISAAVAGSRGVRCVPIGADPVTWRVVSDGRIFDFAPLQGADITTDLRRRDFTLNAIAWAPGERSLLDPLGGVADAEARILRMVLPSNFDDDPLRVLRGVRIAATLDLAIEPATRSELMSRAQDVARAAPERIQYELSRMLSSAAVRGTRLLSELGMARVALGVELSPDTLRTIDRLPAGAPVPMSLAAIYSESGAARATEELRARRWGRDTILAVADLLRAVEAGWTSWSAQEHLAVYALGREGARSVSLLLEALGREPEAKRIADFIAGTAAGWWDTRPLLRGDEIASLTGASGEAIGTAVRRLLAAQLSGEVVDRTSALDYVKATRST